MSSCTKYVFPKYFLNEWMNIEIEERSIISSETWNKNTEPYIISCFFFLLNQKGKFLGKWEMYAFHSSIHLTQHCSLIQTLKVKKKILWYCLALGHISSYSWDKIKAHSWRIEEEGSHSITRLYLQLLLCQCTTYLFPFFFPIQV